MHLERAKEILKLVEDSGNMFPKNRFKPETLEERSFFITHWKNLPGHFSYRDAVLNYIIREENKLKEKSYAK